jgi:hypothetical protein
VTISAVTPAAAEGGAAGQFRVSLSQASSTPTLVTYALTGTASASDHNLAPSGTITIPENQTSVLINVNPVDDNLMESSETVIATLTGVVNNGAKITLGTVKQATVTIADNEVGYTISTVRNGAEPGTPGQFRVTLSKPASQNVIVNYNVSGTATSGVDFTALSGSVTILAGSSSALIDVAVRDDVNVDPGETVTVSLSSASGMSNLAPGASVSATLTIVDNDKPGVIVSAAGQIHTLTEGGTYPISIVLNGTPSSPVTVTILPSSTDVDLGAGPGKAVTRTFTPFNATVPQTITVTAINDSLVNADRTVSVRFTTASATSAFNGLAIAPLRLTILNDDAPAPIVPAPQGPASFGALSTTLRELGNPDSFFAGYAGPNTLQSFPTFFPSVSLAQSSAVLGGGVQQSLIPVLAGPRPVGWGARVNVFDRSGAMISTLAPQSDPNTTWMVALPGINLVDAAWAQVILTPPSSGSGHLGMPQSSLGEVRFRANISGLFDDISGLYETGLLQDQGDILGQVLPTVRM